MLTLLPLSLYVNSLFQRDSMKIKIILNSHINYTNLWQEEKQQKGAQPATFQSLSLAYYSQFKFIFANFKHLYLFLISPLTVSVISSTTITSNVLYPLIFNTNHILYIYIYIFKSHRSSSFQSRCVLAWPNEKLLRFLSFNVLSPAAAAAAALTVCLLLSLSLVISVVSFVE